nr:MAG TPA: DNA primase [Caudoviricetes sp.]
MLESSRIRQLLTTDDIIQLMKALGAIQYLDKGDYLQFPTICHNRYEGDAGFNLSYYVESKRFYCFSNCHSMDIFEVIKKRWELLGVEKYSFLDILHFVLNNSQISLDGVESPETFDSPIKLRDFQIKTEEVILPEKNPHVLELFTDYKADEWLSDGISIAAMDKYGIKFDQLENAIIIPHYDVNGRLIGVRRRALNPEDIEQGKYKPIFKEGQSYSHPLGYNLYGLNLVKDEIRKQRRVFIAEGEKSALQAQTLYGNQNVVVSACGSKINRWQVHLLMKYCQPNEIIVAFDKGLDYSDIHKMCEKYSTYCQFSYLCDSTDTLLRDKESPFDRPDTLDRLIDMRIKVNGN